MEATAVRDALREVIDPELGIDVVSLGLVYDVKVDGGRAEVVMTMTSPACPLGEQLTGDAEAAIRRALPEATEIEVRLVVFPPWTPGLMSAEAKRRLGWPD
jgi:metal-sulfur cluster biosynthetic enzyme